MGPFVRVTMSLANPDHEEAFRFFDRDLVTQYMPPIQAEKKTKQDVINAFKVFDNRSNGMITKENFENMMGNVGEALDKKQVMEASAKAMEIAPSQLDTGEPAIMYEKYVDWMMGSAS